MEFQASEKYGNVVCVCVVGWLDITPPGNVWHPFHENLVLWSTFFSGKLENP